MPISFYWTMSAQFFSSLADNALLIACIALLQSTDTEPWVTPFLKFTFVISYVLLAPFVGAFADSIPKGRVMLITNLIKICGLVLMLFHVHPLLAYGLVGLGAASYSPAKYGILTEMLPAEKLVIANGWIEGLTVLSIILGTLLGGMLISQTFAQMVLGFIPVWLSEWLVSYPRTAIFFICVPYALAALCNLRIPDTGARYPNSHINPIKLTITFARSCTTLWTDKLGQISLAVTTLFWGASATLQFVVLDWAQAAFGMSLSQATTLQAVTAIGVAAGAITAARLIPLKLALKVLPLGAMMGVLVMLMTLTSRTLLPEVTLHLGGLHLPLYLLLGGLLLIMIGALGGFFLVPMNALLQHRGYVLLSAGQSISVQNFNENLSILVMLVFYSFLIGLELNISVVVLLFGGFVMLTMLAVMRWNRLNMKQHDWTQLIGEARH